MPTTENHGYNVPTKGSYDGEWHIPLNENFRMLDKDVVMRGLDNSKPGPGQQGRIYIAHDTQVVYHDTGSAWAVIAGHDLQGNDLIDSTNGTKIYNGSTGQLSDDLVDGTYLSKDGGRMDGDITMSDNGLLELGNTDMTPLTTEPAHKAGRVVLTDGAQWDPDGDGNAELVISTGGHWKEIIDLGVSL